MNRSHLSFVFVVFIFLIFSCSLVHSQQPYIRQATTLCGSTDASTSVLGYTCNGDSRSCQSYLTFRSEPPLNTVSSISALLGADPLQLSQLNSVSLDATFETNRMVLVPVNCSCSGPYYQANVSYTVQPLDEYLTIANNTFQGLSTCQAIQAQNNNLTATSLLVGTRIIVPLRCACPTRNQSDAGVRFLMSYLVTWGQFVSLIGSMFGVDTGETLRANGLSEVDSNIYPFTTLLVPLQNPPSSSQIIEPPPPPPLPPQIPITPPSNRSSNRTWVYALAGTLGGLALASVAGVLVFCFCFRRKKEKTKTINTIDSESFEAIEKPHDKKLDDDSQIFWDSISSVAQSLKVYTYEEIKLATDNFSPNCLIKGSVYRGVINGDFAAIKKKSGDVSGEINLLNKINHYNLIRLSGVCFNDGHWYLVYEFVLNGSLSDWIYSKKGNQKFLNWTQRIQIALDVATGLSYLHGYTSPPHVHKDLTCSNVLLDNDFRAKITNFGLSRSAEGHEDDFALTRHIVGTKGYMAPEYLENGLVSTKLDVYSFGVLMLEILTGKEVPLFYEGANMPLSDILTPELQGKKNLSNFIDASLQGNYPSELAISLIRLIDSCLTKDPSARPSMHEIVQTLSTAMNTPLSWESKLGVSAKKSP